VNDALPSSPSVRGGRRADGSFSLGQASVQFLLVAAGGIAVGLATGWLATQVQKALDDPPVQTMFLCLLRTWLTSAGNSLHVSGSSRVVIAVLLWVARALVS